MTLAARKSQYLKKKRMARLQTTEDATAPRARRSLSRQRVVFSSLPFLFFYLPVTLAVYKTVPLKLRNLCLLLLSLFFYGWGEPGPNCSATVLYWTTGPAMS